MVSPGCTRVEQRHRGAAADRGAGRLPVDPDVVAIGPRREAAGDRDRGLDRHVRHVGILARLRDLAEDEERPIGLDLDRDMRLADETGAQLGGDGARQLLRGEIAGADGADQRHRHLTGGIDEIRVAQPLLPEHHDPQLVAGVEPVGRRRRRHDRDYRRVRRYRGDAWLRARVPTRLDLRRVGGLSFLRLRLLRLRLRIRRRGRAAPLVGNAVEIGRDRERPTRCGGTAARHGRVHAPGGGERDHQNRYEAAWPHATNPYPTKHG